mgnify:CR=1 FL=1
MSAPWLTLVVVWVAAAVAMTLAWRWRMRRLLRIKNRLERLVTERTRELVKEREAHARRDDELDHGL